MAWSYIQVKLTFKFNEQYTLLCKKTINRQYWLLASWISYFEQTDIETYGIVRWFFWIICSCYFFSASFQFLFCFLNVSFFFIYSLPSVINTRFRHYNIILIILLANRVDMEFLWFFVFLVSLSYACRTSVSVNNKKLLSILQYSVSISSNYSGGEHRLQSHSHTHTHSIYRTK